MSKGDFVDLTCDSPEPIDRGESSAINTHLSKQSNGCVMPTSLADIMAARNAASQPRMTAQYLNEPLTQSLQSQHKGTFQQFQQPHKHQISPYVMGQHARSSNYNQRMPIVSVIGEEVDPLAAHIAKSKTFQQLHQSNHAGEKLAIKGKTSAVQFIDAHG